MVMNIKNNMKGKSGQMKIQQMSFLIIAVFIFLAMVGMIVLTVKNSATELREQNAKLLVSKLASSPEFSCGEAYGSPGKTDCIDEDKIMALKDNINKYTGFWRVSNIQIRRIYPSQSNDIECTPSNYPKCNVINLITNSPEGIGQSNFVALCRKETYGGEFVNVCEMAKLIVWYEEAE